MAAMFTILGKDLRLELRSGLSTIALVSLSLLILVVLVFALPASVVGAEPAAGALWVAMVFSGMLGATRALSAERENGCIRALLLSPVDPATLYAAKLAAAFIFMAVAEIAAILMMVLFFNLDFDLRIDPARAGDSARRARLCRAGYAAGRDLRTDARERSAAADAGGADVRPGADRGRQGQLRRAGRANRSRRWVRGSKSWSHSMSFLSHQATFCSSSWRVKISRGRKCREKSRWAAD